MSITYEDEVDAAFEIIKKLLNDYNMGKETWGLIRCELDGEPAIALGYIHKDEGNEDHTVMTPLFLFITQDLGKRVTPPKDTEVNVTSGKLSKILDEDEEEEKKIIN